jgi:hypothetical protein
LPIPSINKILVDKPEFYGKLRLFTAGETLVRYGQKGGDGPNTGKKAAVYLAQTPTGKVLRRRVFNNIPVDDAGQPLTVCTAALLAPHNGHDWSIWVVAASREMMPAYVKDAVFVEATLMTGDSR